MIKNYRLEEKVSKAGTKYVVLVLTFTNGYEKIVFIDKAEEYMLKELNK